MGNLYLLLFLLFTCSSTAAKASEIDELLNNKTVTNNTAPVPLPINEHFLSTTLQHKLDAIADVLSQVDSSVKHMQEQTHSWSIFHHHINSWNDQMNALEHKIELIKRTQEKHQSYGNKLMSLEFTLNHVLSKVIYLSDSDGNNGKKCWTPPDHGANFEDAMKMWHDLLHSATSDRKSHAEILTRLTNVLQRVEKMGSGNCAGSRGSTKGIRNHGPAKLERLMHPVGGCNATQRYNYNLDQSVKALEHQLSSLAVSLPLKDFKQLFALARKNSRTLEEITRAVRQTEVGLVEWREIEANHTRKLHEFCQDVSGELSTFTESSDHLLKRIELVVDDLSEKISNSACEIPSKGNRSSSDEGRKSLDEGAGKHGTEFGSKVDSSTETIESFEVDNGADDADEDHDENHREMHPQTDEIDFMQPSKAACDELSERIDGVYKFSAPEYNEAGRDFNERSCIFATDGAAWTMIQNRGPYGEQENFNRSWAEYRDGFGQLHKDFWFGNEFVHKLVYRDDYELRIEMQDFEDVRVWVDYSLFRIESERYNYNLMIGGYRGAVPDAMQYHNELDFSTYDRRNDKSVDACCACATGYASGWWYDNCSEANLNGVYRDSPLEHNYVGIIWEPWRGDYSLKRARILIRPKHWLSEGGAADEVYNEFMEDP